MKVGFRVPSLSKSLKARTTGKIKRVLKKKVIPFYGKKGMGVINDPQKAIYNKIYNKVTVDTIKPVRKKIDKKIKDTFDFRIK